MSLSEALSELGFRAPEIRVYLYLLEHGIASPAQIAKGTAMLRGNCHRVLTRLEERNLVIRQRKSERRMLYLAHDPTALFQDLEHKRQLVETLVPDLRALHTTQPHKPTIRFYEGLEEIKQIYLQTLEAKEIYAIGSIEPIRAALGGFLLHYVNQVKKKNIIVHDILSHASLKENSKDVREILRGLHDVRFLDSKDGDFVTDIFVWNDQVGLLTLRKPYFGTIITSPVLSQSMRLIFKALWGRLSFH